MRGRISNGYHSRSTDTPRSNPINRPWKVQTPDSIRLYSCLTANAVAIAARRQIVPQSATQGSPKKSAISIKSPLYGLFTKTGCPTARSIQFGIAKVQCFVCRNSLTPAASELMYFARKVQTEFFRCNFDFSLCIIKKFGNK
ncbi:unnamed protein product [Owenia fusiformis]|uniref:Uncharacterized protein n=1 Tax=Owenia fusiformis TaxID=6347 RepID=A0A8J1XP64_OWEFU|nr:unnamed protein product [Owenia fusiformis]